MELSVGDLVIDRDGRLGIIVAKRIHWYNVRLVNDAESPVKLYHSHRHYDALRIVIKCYDLLCDLSVNCVA